MSLLNSLGLLSDSEQEIHCLLLHTGTALEGSVLYFVFCGREWRPRWVVKTARDKAFSPILMAEGKAIGRITGRLAGTSMTRSLPQLLFVGEYEHTPVLVEGYQRGGHHLSGIRAHEQECTRQYLKRVAAWLSQFQRHTRKPRDSATDIAALLKLTLDEFSTGCTLLEYERAGLLRLEQDIPGLSDQLYLCAVHGDFSFNNVRASGSELSVLDWEFYRDSGLSVIDPAFWAGALVRFWLRVPMADLLHEPSRDTELETYWGVLRTQFLLPYSDAVELPLEVLEKAIPFGFAASAVRQLSHYGFHSEGDYIARLMFQFWARRLAEP